MWSAVDYRAGLIGVPHAADTSRLTPPSLQGDRSCAMRIHPADKLADFPRWTPIVLSRNLELDKTALTATILFRCRRKVNTKEKGSAAPQ
jgi:hypothetical protein